MRVFTMSEIDERGIAACMDEALARATDGTAGVHLSFDLDGVDPRVRARRRHRRPRRPHLPRGAPRLREGRAAPGKLLGMDIVELNPILDERNRTAQLARRADPLRVREDDPLTDADGARQRRMAASVRCSRSLSGPRCVFVAARPSPCPCPSRRGRELWAIPRWIGLVQRLEGLGPSSRLWSLLRPRLVGGRVSGCGEVRAVDLVEDEALREVAAELHEHAAAISSSCGDALVAQSVSFWSCPGLEDLQHRVGGGVLAGEGAAACCSAGRGCAGTGAPRACPCTSARTAGAAAVSDSFVLTPLCISIQSNSIFL